jgi:hypothetical protein
LRFGSLRRILARLLNGKELAMVQLMLTLLFLAAAPPMGGAPNRVILRDRLEGPTPVTDKFLIPPKLKDCRTEADVRAALEARRYGDLEPCDPDPMLRRAR